ncbi:sensor histidine kinase [Corynebacterium tuberculostearicum]|uniref:sensor histidine kinase n=1 Tax=Corynebacterium tuberculostearicum TaxID=38304 RepID=UPI002934A576|nr:sensor histidine kinase [Corynebacterium tuberculostearicum]
MDDNLPDRVPPATLPRQSAALMSSLREPFRGFSLNSALFASVWLVFLIPGLVITFAAPGLTLKNQIGALSCALVFGLVYFFAFGAGGYYPRGWRAPQRIGLYWFALAAIALLSTSFFGSIAVIFVPYLAAFLGFNLPLRHSLTFTLLTGAVVAAATWYFTPNNIGWALIVLFAWPILLVLLGTFSQRQDSRAELERRLELARQREDIATDVHDLLGHSLTVINLKSELARRLVDTDPQRAKQEMQEVSELSRKGLAEVRSTVTRMRTPSFEGEIYAARRALKTAGIAPYLPSATKTAGPYDAQFSWALRELTTNVIRHSGATHCWVQVTDHQLQVADDGCGFDGEERLLRPQGGISGLRKRVRKAGGQLLFTHRNNCTLALVTMNGDNEFLPLSADGGVGDA